MRMGNIFVVPMLVLPSRPGAGTIPGISTGKRAGRGVGTDVVSLGASVGTGVDVGKGRSLLDFTGTGTFVAGRLLIR